MNASRIGELLGAVLVVAGASAGCSSSAGVDGAGPAVADAAGAEEDAGFAPDAGADAPLDDGEPADDVAALAVSASISANPNMVVSALVDVTAPGADEVVVHHGDDVSYPYATPPVAVDASGHATVVILGLSPGATTHVEVTARSTGGRTGSTGDLTFDAAPIPPSLGLPASFAITTDDGTASGFVLSSWDSPTAENALMLDRHGRVMWYRHYSAGMGLAFDRLPNGHFVLAETETGDFVEVDLAGDFVRRYSVDASTASVGLDGHELLPLPDGHLAAIGLEINLFDSSPYFPGGGPGARRLDNRLLDLDPLGGARVLWASYGDVQPDEMRPDPSAPFDPLDIDLVHANAVTLAPDGNLLLSCRELSQIIKIDRATGAVLWRLGGKRSDFVFQGDPEGGFALQHDPRFTSSGELRVFDNGNLHATQESRVVQYALDETAKTATMTWEYRHLPPMYSQIAGSARDVPSGHVLVDFARTGTAVEIDAQHVVHWELQGLASGAYRMVFVPTLYP